MMQLSSWFSKKPLHGPLRPGRRPAPGLAAYQGTGSLPRQYDVKDISCTGVYLLTEERWTPGTPLSLTLQKKGPPEESSEHRITRQAKAVRWGDDGVGLSFVLPRDLDRNLWDSLLACTPQELEPGDVLREFRLAAALAFLARICSPAAAETKSLLCGGLSNYRALSAVQIALGAEEVLASRPDPEEMRAHAHLVMRILEDGSWAKEEWIVQMWAGLLAASCSNDENDESNLPFVDVFSQLAATHVHLFTAACKEGAKAVSESGSVSSLPVVCTQQEIIKLTGWHDLARIERDLAHLSELGLLEKNDRFSFFSQLDEAHITPSRFALQLYALCNGHRGAAQEFYEVASAPPVSV